MTTGRAAGTVLRTGAASALGRIAALVAGTRPGPTPLQRRLAGLGRVLGRGRGGAVRPWCSPSACSAASRWSRWSSPRSAWWSRPSRSRCRRWSPWPWRWAPAGWPPARAIPRRLHAVETLGSVTVHRLRQDRHPHRGPDGGAARCRRPTAPATASPARLRPDGAVRATARPVTAPQELRRAGAGRAALQRRHACAAAPTTARRGRAVGDPMEAALLAFAGRCGLDRRPRGRRGPGMAEHPFDRRPRRMTTVHRAATGGYLVVCKGAPESVLRPLLDADRRRVAALTAAADSWPPTGCGCWPSASRRPSDDGARPGRAGPACGLLGLVGDRRPAAGRRRPTSRGCRRAGIRLVLITGDHPATAAAIGGQLGIVGAPATRSSTAATPTPAQAGRAARVFARTQPEQKLDIIDALCRPRATWSR